MTDPIYSTTGHRADCPFWGGIDGECYCFDDDEDLAEDYYDDYYVDGDTDW